MVSQTPAGGLLNDRIAVVTGGGGGIGAATARLFADHGAQVIRHRDRRNRGDP